MAANAASFGVKLSLALILKQFILWINTIKQSLAFKATERFHQDQWQFRCHSGSSAATKSSPESKFKEVTNFGLSCMILARSFDTFWGRYMLEVFSQGGCKQVGRQILHKWPPFKMAAKILNYIKLREKLTYLGFNCI